MDSDDENINDGKVHENKPYDESVEITDSEDIYTPRVATTRKALNKVETPLSSNRSSDTPTERRMEEKMNNNESSEQKPKKLGVIAPGSTKSQVVSREYADEEDEEDDSGSSDEDDDEEDDEDAATNVEGAYNPADYEHLVVTPEIKELFQYIQRYTPQTIELEHKLRPFIPDFIPAVGDIDAFIKVNRPDHKQDGLGLIVLDEPCARQSDATVLDLQLRAVFKQSISKEVVVRSIENADRKTKEINSWIKSITDLHRSKPPPTVHYPKNMPDIDSLMQEWPADIEELLKEVSLPTADLECDLTTYVDIICNILDIPIYKNRIHSLHVLFTLYSEFKNSQHFQHMSEVNNPGIANRMKFDDG